MTSNGLPDYIGSALLKRADDKDRPVDLREFGTNIFEMWNGMTQALEELGKYPQRFRFKRRPLKGAKLGDMVMPGRQPNLFFYYLVEELAETLRYIQLTFAYRLQALLEELVLALQVARLTSVPLATRALMETCAALKDVRRKEKEALGDVLKLRAKEFARLEALAVNRSASEEDRAKAEAKVKEAFFLLFNAVATARNFTLTFKSDLLLEEAHGKGHGIQLPKPTNILTLIDNRLKFSEASSSPRFYYELLSEMVHPNTMAFAIYFGGTYKAPDGLEISEVEATTKSPRTVLGVLGAVVDPIIECIPSALADLVEMERETRDLMKLAGQLRHYLKR